MAMKIARLSKACDEALAAYNAAAKRALDAEDAKKAFGFVAEEMVIAAVIETVGPDPELKELRGELIDAVALAVERATNPKSSN
ncbi:hypothetical protein [Hoeflea sp.]|uniref:hypothetical protein n=1 Tax=Hoeflea sp. TaxID=1940281 RepID=UPI003B5222BD